MSFARTLARFSGLFLLLPSLAALAACDDPNDPFGQARILTDTVSLLAPDAARPLEQDTLGSALNVAQGNIAVTRPERPANAGLWDVALRRRGAELVLAPPAALGIATGLQSRAAITRPITGRSFEEVRDAPGTANFVTDTAVVLSPNAVYVIRSRTVCSFGSGATYAKIQPLAVDVAAGTVQLQVSANATCDDSRLVVDD